MRSLNMANINLFWSVYKNLENELLTLTKYIHFSDKQLSVYSMHIGDLIVRCAIEIEAISKALYEQLGGNMSPVDSNGNDRDLYFDTDCIDFLEQKWQLSQKKLSITSISAYFEEEDNLFICPLRKANKRGTSGCKWKQAYQAIKHNRLKSLKVATLGNLIHALGALYILNLYYKSDIYELNNSGTNFDDRVGSSFFSVLCYSATGLSMSYEMDDNNIYTNSKYSLAESIYIKRYTEESYISMHKAFCLDAKITEQNFASSTIIQNYLKEHPESAGRSINQICFEAGGDSLLMSIVSFKHSRKEIRSKIEAVVNKHEHIYPTVSYKSDGAETNS